MTQVLPEAKVGRDSWRSVTAGSRRVMSYAVPARRGGSAGVATAGLACGVLFFGVVALAGSVHPKIEAPLLALIVALPVAALVLGSVAGRRAKRAGGREPGRAVAAVWLGGGELALVLAFSLMVPSLCRAREPANRAK